MSFSGGKGYGRQDGGLGPGAGALPGGLSLKALDVFPKTIAEFRHKTASGGVVSLVCTALIVLLTLAECADFLTARPEEHLSVDTSRGQTMEMRVDITFPALPCSIVHLELQDISGNHQLDLSRDITKSRLDRDGTALAERALPKGNAAVAEVAKAASQDHGRAGASLQLPGAPRGGPLVVGPGEKVLLSSLLAELLPGVFADDDAVAQLRSHLGEGCRVQGTVTMNKVAGNFHFSVDRSDQAALLSVFKGREGINMSHAVTELAFGESYPGLVNPLDGVSKMITSGSGFFQYQLKVVPTVYEHRSGHVISTNQYSFTELFRSTEETDKLPFVFFHYELSPIMARLRVASRPLGSFLTGLCAIVGGVFTLSGVVDALLFRLVAKPGLAAGAAR